MLSANKQKSPRRILSDYRANFGMPALECQPAMDYLGPSTQPSTPPDTGSPWNRTRHYILPSATLASSCASLHHARPTVKNSLYVNQGTLVSVMPPPSALVAFGSLGPAPCPPLSGESSGPTTSANQSYPSTTHLAPSPTLIWRWQACCYSTSS